MTDDILVLNPVGHKYKSFWRKTRLAGHFHNSESCMSGKKINL